MNRFNYPFTRILTKPCSIKNTHSLDLQQITARMSEDKYLHKKKTLKHFLPDSDGKIIYSSGEDLWFVIEQVTPDEIAITAVQKDTALYGLFAFIGFWLLLILFSSVFRRFTFGFIVFSLMIYGLVVIAKKVGDSQLNGKLAQLEKAINTR